jgi:hypothetical protein
LFRFSIGRRWQMPQTPANDWLGLARQHHIDPDEVRMVYSRYDAQRRFYAGGRGEAMVLRRWFEFYRMEKSTEGRRAGSAPSGCSVDSAAVNDACIERPAEFLMVLEAYAEATA